MILAQAVGVPVGRRLGGLLATTLFNYFLHHITLLTILILNPPEQHITLSNIHITFPNSHFCLYNSWVGELAELKLKPIQAIAKLSLNFN